MAGLRVLEVETRDDADDGRVSETGSAEACGRETKGLRERIDALLASAGTTDGSRIIAGEEIDGGFVVMKSGGKRVNGSEVSGIGRALGDKFQLERVRINEGGGKVYVVKPRNVAPNEGGVNGGRTGRKERRRNARAARQAGLRATNPRLKPV